MIQPRRIGGSLTAMALAVALMGCAPSATQSAQEAQPTASTSVVAESNSSSTPGIDGALPDASASPGSDSSTAGESTAELSPQPEGDDAEGVHNQWAAVAKRVAPSVVAISVQGGRGSSSGSGVVLDKQGHVVTNHHVIASAANGGQILVTLSDEQVLAASVVGSDPASDLAVLKVAEPPAELAPIELGSSDELAVGDPVMAVGNPLGLAGTVTTGIVSALNRPVVAGDQQQGMGSEPVVTNAIQTSAAVNPGNSGGALVDGKGRLVGINSSIATLGQGSGSIGIGFAITVKQMSSVVEQIMRTGTVQHSYLGVGVVDAIVEVDGKKRWAAGIQNVQAGSAGASAGLKAKDGVLAIDGESVDSARALIAQIRERSVGTEVKLTVARDGKQVEVPVKLVARPA